MGAVRTTGRGAALLFAAVVALLVAGRYDLPALLPVTGLLLALVLLGLVAVLLMPRRLDVRRSVATRILDHGSNGTMLLRVVNRSPVRALDVTWRALLPAGLGGPAVGPVGGLGPRRTRAASADLDLRFTGTSRGRHDLGPLLIEVRDPFGVVVRRRRITDDADIVVLPRRVVLPQLTSVHGTGTARVGRRSTRRRGDGEDDVVSRSYQPGDPPKRIDWRTTARRGELMVRQEEPSTADRVAVVIDPGTVAGSTEWALVAGCSVIAHLAEDGHVVTTVVPGREPRTAAGGRESALPSLVDLACLTHRDREEIGVAPVDGRAVVAVLGVVGEERAREWVAALRRSERVLALVAADSGDPVLALLRSAGWRVVAWDDADDVVTHWTALGSAQGREVNRATS